VTKTKITALFPEDRIALDVGSYHYHDNVIEKDEIHENFNQSEMSRNMAKTGNRVGKNIISALVTVPHGNLMKFLEEVTQTLENIHETTRGQDFESNESMSFASEALQLDSVALIRRRLMQLEEGDTDENMSLSVDDQLLRERTSTFRHKKSEAAAAPCVDTLDKSYKRCKKHRSSDDTNSKVTQTRVSASKHNARKTNTEKSSWESETESRDMLFIACIIIVCTIFIIICCFCL